MISSDINLSTAVCTLYQLLLHFGFFLLFLNQCYTVFSWSRQKPHFIQLHFYGWSNRINLKLDAEIVQTDVSGRSCCGELDYQQKQVIDLSDI